MMGTFFHGFVLIVGAILLSACSKQPREQPSEGSQRIVSQTVFADEVLWNLGPRVQARVVAVSSLADDETYSGVALKWPESVPRIPTTAEHLLSVLPDVVFITEFTRQETVVALEQAGLQLYKLSGFTGFSDFRRHVQGIADRVGESSAGKELVAHFDRELLRLRAPRDYGLSVVSWHDGMVPAMQTTFSDIAEAAGLRNLPGTLGFIGHHPTPIEQLLIWNPDVLVVSCEVDDCTKREQEFMQRPEIKVTRAGQHQRVIAVPTHQLYSTGMGMLAVVKILRERVKVVSQ